MKVDDASSVLDTLKKSATENNIEDLIRASEDAKVEETVDNFYSDLTSAMAAQNDELQNAIMDNILEAYNKAEKNLRREKEPKKIKKDKVKPKVKWKKRGQGRPSTNL
jgi:N-acetylglucosamine kinase-like BadF-type ATPase